MRGTLKVSLSATGLALAVSAAVYPWLPERVPVHFNLAGEANGWASRPIGAFMLPAFMLVAMVIDVARRGANPAIGTTTALVSAFSLVLHVLVLRAALTGDPLSDAIWFLTGLFFVLIGLVLPRLRRNLWIGVRTPWSLSSPEAWAQSQRVGGRAMAIAGLFVLLSSAWSGPAMTALRAMAILGAAVVSIGYSYVAARTST